MLMICVQQEDTVHRLRKREANGIFLTGSREHHVQEVLCITHVIARVDERLPLSVFVAHGRWRRHFRYESMGSDHSVLRIIDVRRVVVEGG